MRNAAFRNVIVIGVFTVNFSRALVRNDSMNAASTLNLAHTDRAMIWLPWPTVINDAFEGFYSTSRRPALIPQTSCHGIEAFDPSSPRNEATGFHILDLDALLALGPKPELGLGFELLRFGESSKQYIALTDEDWTLVEPVPSRGSLPSSV